MHLSLPSPVKEFLTAAAKPYSYNILNNIYIIFGILWGLPIPLVTLCFEVHILQSTGAATPFTAAFRSPIQWFFLAHPLIFAVIFGILGTIRFEKDLELKRKIDELKALSIHDALTGLKNRRYFAHIFHDECARVLRRGESLALLFFDIDHFKQINDSHGHHLGDMVLKELGSFLRQRCRPYDTAVRWGGEEFLVLLPATAERTAMDFAERIRKGVESGFSTAIRIPVTISIGLAEYRIGDTLETITDRADRALYHAKQTGRNKTIPCSALEKNMNGSQRL